MFVPVLDQYPLLKTVKPESWDFFVTVAGVFIAASRLQNLQLSDNRKQELMDVVARGLTDWSPENGIRGFEDCKAMFERNFDSLTRSHREPRFVASDALGMWVVWNLLGRAPADEEERKLVRTVGAAVVHNFFFMVARLNPPLLRRRKGPSEKWRRSHGMPRQHMSCNSWSACAIVARWSGGNDDSRPLIGVQ